MMQRTDIAMYGRCLVIVAAAVLFTAFSVPAFAADGVDCQRQGGGASCGLESECDRGNMEDIGQFDCADAADPSDDPFVCCRPLQVPATESGCDQLHGTCRVACDDATEEARMTCEDNSIERVCCVQKVGGTGAETAASARGSDTKIFDPLQGANLVEILNRIVQTFLGVVGAIALLVFFYAGVVYMTAGNSDRIKQAIAAMKYAAIGLLIIMSAYIISSVYITSLTNIPSQPKSNITLPE